MRNKLVEDGYYGVWLALVDAKDAVARVREEELRPFELEPVHFRLLFLVASHRNNITPAELSRLMFRKPHTISEILKHLERRGMVSKVKDLKRANMVRVVLTNKGTRILRVMSSRVESIDRIMSCLSDKEREQLKSYLKKIQEKALNELGLAVHVVGETNHQPSKRVRKASLILPN